MYQHLYAEMDDVPWEVNTLSQKSSEQKFKKFEIVDTSLEIELKMEYNQEYNPKFRVNDINVFSISVRNSSKLCIDFGWISWVSPKN